MLIRLLRASLVAAVGVALVACSGGDDDGADGTPVIAGSPTVSATMASRTASAGSADAPVGIIAIGHSGLTGVSTVDLDRDSKENSWATGDSPEVNSIYLRLVNARPETEGHVANVAVNGAEARTLAIQAQSALKQVPFPQLVLIQTIENDIRCDGTDVAHVPEFGQQVSAALRVIADASPKTTIVLLSSLGRPASYADYLETLPTSQHAGEAGGPCAFFTPSGERAPEGIANLTAIIEGYEAELDRVCATVSQCRRDGGLFKTYADTAEGIAIDGQHLSIVGHARTAELLWPLVVEVLGLE